jgi:hypothetical protein
VGSRRPLTQVLFSQKERQGFRNKDSGTMTVGQGMGGKGLVTRIEGQGMGGKGLVTTIQGQD